MTPKVVLITVPADDPKQTAEFYSALFGIEFARTFTDAHVAYHVPISDDGRLFQVQKKFRPDDAVTCYFAVDDLNAAIKELKAEGATVVTQPMDLPVSRQVLQDYKELFKQSFGTDAADTIGTGAVLKDPAGNRFGLVQLHEHAQPMFKYGKYATHPRHLSEERYAMHTRTIAIGKRMR